MIEWHNEKDIQFKFLTPQAKDMDKMIDRDWFEPLGKSLHRILCSNYIFYTQYISQIMHIVQYVVGLCYDFVILKYTCILQG